ncbi:unnamed protein product [Caenorhabditis auriculariae]|uniref:Uncharacterized protein n=1 Tax=Caenorhabditis auriculariae TaxID=2777116 RepID=A0A8S1GXP6_9PELO|nr:unnamed protein product [Caenorhabditis auriculariae]
MIPILLLMLFYRGNSNQTHVSAIKGAALRFPIESRPEIELRHLLDKIVYLNRRNPLESLCCLSDVIRGRLILPAKNKGNACEEADKDESSANEAPWKKVAGLLVGHPNKCELDPIQISRSSSNENASFVFTSGLDPINKIKAWRDIIWILANFPRPQIFLQGKFSTHNCTCP